MADISAGLAVVSALSLDATDLRSVPDSKSDGPILITEAFQHPNTDQLQAIGVYHLS